MTPEETQAAEVRTLYEPGILKVGWCEDQLSNLLEEALYALHAGGPGTTRY